MTNAERLQAAADQVRRCSCCSECGGDEGFDSCDIEIASAVAAVLADLRAAEDGAAKWREYFARGDSGG